LIKPGEQIKTEPSYCLNEERANTSSILTFSSPPSNEAGDRNQGVFLIAIKFGIPLGFNWNYLITSLSLLDLEHILKKYKKELSMKILSYSVGWIYWVSCFN